MGEEQARTETAEETAAGPRVSARGVSKSYGAVVALASTDLDVADGEAVAIMGPSGSGKSTLLHVLTGIIRPDSGQVLFRGQSGVVDVVQLSDTERSALRLAEFGFVFQQGFLIPELTAGENIAMPLLLQGTGRSEARRAARAVLAELGLDSLEGRRIGQLSGGQAQRVAIGRAKVTGARIVFADEPTGALDSVAAREVLDALLASTTGQGRSLVIVTHDEDVAERCSRIVRFRDGRIVDDGRRAIR